MWFHGFRVPEFLMLKILGIHETTYALAQLPQFEARIGRKSLVFNARLRKVGTTFAQFFGDPEAFGEDEAEVVQEDGLGSVGADYATQADRAAVADRQQNVGALDAGEFLQQGGNAVTQTGFFGPAFQHPAKHECQEADQDMSLDPVGRLVPHRPQPEFVLLNLEVGFRVGQLDLGPPELFA